MAKLSEIKEQKRLDLLRLYDILDTLPEQEFDDITQLASEICKTPIALISLIDENRQWIKSRVGLDIQETSRDISFCSHAIEGQGIFEVLDPTVDSRFADNPLVTGFPGIRYYAGAPLVTPEGLSLGTLCVINSVPHEMSEGQKRSLQILARSVMSMMELRHREKESKFFMQALNEVAAVAVTDSKDHYHYVNDKFCALAELPKTEIEGKPVSELGLADITESDAQYIEKQVKAGKVYRGRVKNQGRKGDYTWSNLTLIPYTNRHQEINRVFSIRVDITQEVQMLQRLEEAEKLSHSGNWEYNLVSGDRYWSKGMYRIMGYDPVEMSAAVPTMLDLVIPEQRDALQASVSQLLQGDKSREMSQLKACRKDGAVRDYVITSQVMRNVKGQVLSLAGTMQDITEQKETERRLKESLDYIRDLYDQAPCGYHSLDKDMRITDVNATELTWLGYQKEEMLGKQMTELIAKETVEAYHQEWTELRETGVLKDKQRRFRRKDGSYLETIISARATYDAQGNFSGARVTVYDTTEIRKAQLQLEASEFKYRSLVEDTSQLIFSTDKQGYYTYASPRIKKIIGYEDEEILGTRFSFILNDEWRMKTIRFYTRQALLNIPETTYEFPIRTKDGRILWLEQVATLIKEGTEVTGFKCVVHDITERVKTEENIRESARLANKAKEMQQDFLGRMSHEIRTPMNGVVGMVNLLKDSPLNENQLVYVEGIHESANNMLRIINDILDISKIEAGKVVFEEQEFDLRHLVKSVMFTIEPAAALKQVEITCQVDEAIPRLIIGDSLRLNQILLNLAGNGLKFTEKGSVAVEVKQTSRAANRVSLEFRVADTGIGIPKDKLESIFESYTQAEGDTARRFGGTGLGLTIARQLIEQQGGLIRVESEVGKGTTFIFTYHCAVPEEDDNNLEAKVSADELFSFKGKRVLVVEDNSINQKVARFTLQKWGAEVTLADRGVKAIELLKGNSFDVILMDIQMPEMNGLQTTRIIRNELGVTIPILAMTASAMKGERELCLEAGMNDYFSKPFEPKDLNRRLGQYLAG